MADFFHDRWDDVPDSKIDEIGERTGYSDQEEYQAHYMIFADLLDGDETQSEREQIWDDYLSAMVEGEMSFDEFFDSINMDPADFDWDGWREAMGYD